MVHLAAANAVTDLTYTSALDDDARWQAMVDRDIDETGPFVVGVTSTGIYCRVGCPARRPLRRNVLFFESVEDARAAGLRPCKRCHPDDVPELHASL
ncbi:MAG TPA: Ada metal-binding domain-containing protein [Thermomicrobiales bacterium]|nr:Ada metal-binding domain-containing protein [Thermomicrobiales bacterium]